MKRLISISARSPLLKQTADNFFSKLENLTEKPSFVIISGPTLSAADAQYLQSLKFPCNVIGASSPMSFLDGNTGKACWNMVGCVSPYIDTAISTANLAIPDNGDDISKAVKAFISGFPNGYFGVENTPITGLPIRRGGHGVAYRRPAFLLLFLPGTSNPDGVALWPSSDRDYEIVEKLSALAARGLSIFGGSASTGFLKDSQGWVYANGKILSPGIAGMLVETDLAFQFGYSHGFMLSESQEYYTVKEVQNPPVELLGPKSRPDRYHIVKLQDRNGDSCMVPRIPSPEQRSEGESSAILSPEVLHETLVVCEANEVFANPPYGVINPDTTFAAFLRPVESGSRMHKATITYDSVMNASSTAVHNAIAAGELKSVTFAFAINCWGRVVLLGTNVPNMDARAMKKTLPPQEDQTLFGLYGDGETCPAPTGVNYHRNWTSAVVLFSSELSTDYVSAAGPYFASSLVTPRGPDRILKATFANNAIVAQAHPVVAQILRALVEYTHILSQANWVHIRVLSEDGKKLDLFDGAGLTNSYMLPNIDVTEGSIDSASLSYRAFHSVSDDPVVQRSKEYLGENGFGRRWIPASPQEVQKEAEGIIWWVSIPIRLKNDCIGTLSIDTIEPSFAEKMKEGTPLRNALKHLISAAALLLMALRKQQAMAASFAEACSAMDSKSLAQAIVKHGSLLLGRKVFLSLLLPEEYSKPGVASHMRCFGLSGPTPVDENAVAVSINANSTREARGVSGWLFVNNHDEMLIDDVVTEASGDDKDGPVFKPCMSSKISANYVVGLRDENDPRRPLLGVINAEAPAGILDKATHGPILRQLAAVCVPIIRNLNVIKNVKRQLKRTLPNQIAEAALTEMAFEVLPARRLITMLSADVHDYTRLSNVIGEDRIKDFLQEYYDIVGSAVTSNGGYIDKFMGDGVLAFFGASDGLNQLDAKSEVLARQALESACASALRICQRFAELARSVLPQWRMDCPEIGYDFRLTIGVGVHVGRPLVGMFAPRSDSGDDATGFSYTAVGKDVNLVSRIAAEAKDNQVLCSVCAGQLLQKSVRFRVIRKEKQPIQLKGFGPIEVVQLEKRSESPGE